MRHNERAATFSAYLIFLAIPLALVVTGALRLDSVKPMWFDEIIVSRIASQPRIQDISGILVSGQSPHPPLNFLAVRCLYAVFGKTESITRLPSTIGFAVMEACLFLFVAKRSNAVFGLVAIMLPLATMARGYASEAKPYGSLLGWTGVALLCWRSTGTRKSRIWALPGLATALGCATSTHFFGAMVCVPVMAGEVTRWMERRKPDWAVATAATFSFWPLALYAPILRAGGRIHGEHPWQAALGAGFPLRSMDEMLAGCAGPILVCLLALAASRFVQRTIIDETKFPPDELAAVSALALLPAIAFCGLRLARVNAVEVKYVLPMVAGAAVLFAWGSFRLAGRKTSAGLAITAILAVWAIRGFLWDLEAARASRRAAETFEPPVPALPVVVETPAHWMLEHYAKPEVAKRMHFLLDPESAMRYIHSDALQRSVSLNPGFFGERVEKMEEFTRRYPEFIVYEPLSGDRCWILELFLDEGAKVDMIQARADGRWYSVKLAGDQINSDLTIRSALR